MSEKLDPVQLTIATSNVVASKNGSIYETIASAAMQSKKQEELNKKAAAELIDKIPEMCRVASGKGEWSIRVCGAEGSFYSTGKSHPICGGIYYGTPCGATTMVYDYCVAIFGKLRTFFTRVDGVYYLNVTWAEITDEQLRNLDKSNDLPNS